MAVVERVTGLNELQGALNAAGPAWSRDLSKAHKVVAQRGVKFARSAARGGTRSQRRSAAAIRPSATKTRARINVANTRSAPMALATFWGRKSRSGFYAAEKFRGSGRPQGPVWVGNSWRAGVSGEGPHVINDAIADNKGELVEVYETQVEKVVKSIAARRITSF